jgi:hypothetical protein
MRTRHQSRYWIPVAVGKEKRLALRCLHAETQVNLNLSILQNVGSLSFCASAGCPICPDFLRRLVALIHFMRLSLMKGAHVDISGIAWQEIGVKPAFGLSGITLLPVRAFLRSTRIQSPPVLRSP